MKNPLVSGRKIPRFGLLVLRMSFSAVVLLFGVSHLVSGAKGMTNFGEHLHSAQSFLHFLPPLAWGILTAVLEIVCASLLIWGKAMKPACLVILLPIALEFIARMFQATPIEFLLPIVLMAGFLGLFFLDLKKRPRTP